MARLNGIEIVGSLGVRLLARREGTLASLKLRVEQIRAAGIRFSDDLVAEALRLGGE